MRNEKINYFALILVVVVHQIIGFLWYSPFLFGNQWLAAVGKAKEELNGGSNLPYIGAIAGSFLMCFVLAKILYATHSTSVGQGMKLAFLVWLGFIFPVIGISNLFIGLSLTLTLINSGHFLLDMLIAGAILAVFR